jgi:hypothetical protein
MDTRTGAPELSAGVPRIRAYAAPMASDRAGGISAALIKA